MPKYAFADYHAHVMTLIKDSATKLNYEEAGDLDRILKQAVGIFNQDSPQYVKKLIGVTEATREFNLADCIGGLWTPGFSRVKAIEYPLASDPPEYLEPNEDYYLYDDGSAQDGSNLILRISGGVVANFILEFSLERAISREGDANWLETSFDFACVTYKAAQLTCMALANAYIPAIDATISADSVNYSNMHQKYIKMVEEYGKIYNRMVFGSEDAQASVNAGMVDVHIQTQTSQRRSTLFHN